MSRVNLIQNGFCQHPPDLLMLSHIYMKVLIAAYDLEKKLFVAPRDWSVSKKMNLEYGQESTWFFLTVWMTVFFWINMKNASILDGFLGIV